MKLGLVLEGGGMRGIYTSGVLDQLMEEKKEFDYVIGVSAGACNGASFLSGQKGRSYRINIGYIRDKRYLSLRNFIREKSLFGMDFLFEEIPERLEKFDYDAFLAARTEFVVGTTNAQSGRPEYFSKEQIGRSSLILRASSSIPMFAPAVRIGEKWYLDGGTSDPIPVKKALEDGCDRVVVVLTQHRGYVKEPQRMQPLVRRALRDYPRVADILKTRHEGYNRTLRWLNELEQEKRAVVIAPQEPLAVDCFEKRRARLDAAYHQGMLDARRAMDRIRQQS